MEFVNLNNEDSLINITEESVVLKPKEKIIADIEVPQLEYVPKVPKDTEELLLQESCGIEKFYGDTSPEDYFRRENLFSELVNDYQRAKARYNLGIGEEYSLVWGNITGSIENQQDLYAFVTNKFIEYVNMYSDIVNNLLVQWALEITYLLSQKLDKYSPHLEGIPTTTLPEIDDDSARVASTEWVNAKISMNEDNTLKWLKLNKTYMYMDDLPQTIILTWDFYNTPQELFINGLSIHTSLREFTFRNVADSFIIHFSYKVNDKWYNKFLTFQKVHAYYFGITDNINLMAKTKDSSMIVNSPQDKFVYLYIPNDNKARLSVDNIIGGFRVIGGTVINGINYYLYRTVNSGLGELYIKYDKQ